MKCGKEMCEIEHGPYYYAYWKDPESKKLKKKTLAIICQRIRNQVMITVMTVISYEQISPASLDRLNCPF